MKLSWDLLNNLKYNKKIKKLRTINKINGTHHVYYFIKDSCKNCRDEFLTGHFNEKFCSLSCAFTKEHHPLMVKNLHLKEKLTQKKQDVK